MKLAMIFWLTFTMNILDQVISSPYYSGSLHGHPDGNSDGQQCTCTCSNDNTILHADNVFPYPVYPNIHQNSGSSHHSSHNSHSSHSSHSSYKYTKHIKKIHKILKNIQKNVANVNSQSIGHNVGFRSGSIHQSGVGR